MTEDTDIIVYIYYGKPHLPHRFQFFDLNGAADPRRRRFAQR